MINEYKIGFWNTNSSPEYFENCFGCSVLGYSNYEKWINPDEKDVAFWDKKLVGQSITGNYFSVLESLAHLKFKPKFCLVFFNKASGMEKFIRQISIKLPDVQIIGGGAARADGQAVGELMPSSEDVSVLAVSEGDFKFQSLNIYDKTYVSVEIQKINDREFEMIRLLPDGQWQNALEFYRELQIKNNIEHSNF